MRIVAFFVAIILFVAIPTGRAVRGWCRLAPERRPWILAASIVTLGVVTWILPKIGKLHPPWSESPSGLFLILGRGIILTVVASAALGGVAGAILSYRDQGPDSAI